MVTWVPVAADSSVVLTGDEHEALASWNRHRPDPPACFKEAGVAGSEAVVAIWYFNASYTGDHLWDDLKNVDFEPRQLREMHRSGRNAFAVGFHAPYQARAAAVALDDLGKSACEVFKSYHAEGPLDDPPRVQLWVPTADPEASEIPLWMHTHIRRKKWRRCETEEELRARHAELAQED